MRCLSLRQVEEETGLEYRIVLNAVKSGQLQAFTPPGMVRKRFVRDAEVERWIKAMEQESNGK